MASLITIRGNTLDPAKPGNIVLLQDASNVGYILVQLTSSLDQKTLDPLQKLGAKFMKRMVDNNWLCKYGGKDLRAVKSVPGVQFAVVYLPFFRVHANLKGTSSVPLTVTIILHEDVSKPDAVVSELQKIPKTKILVSSDRIINAEVQRADLDKIAQINQIQAVERLTPIGEKNDRIRSIVKLDAVLQLLNTVQPGPNAELAGKGQIIAVADTGVDTDHAMFTGKVEKKFSYGGLGKLLPEKPVLENPDPKKPDPKKPDPKKPDPKKPDPTKPDPTKPDPTKLDPKILDIIKSLKEGEDYNGHGTHVAGTALGATFMVNAFDTRGMASQAKLVVQSIPFGNVPGLPSPTLWTLNEVVKDAYNAGARVQNHSWGVRLNSQNPIQPLYTAVDAEVVDKNAYDQLDMLLVFAAGNDGKLNGLPAQVGSYAAAKNALTVGASYTDRPRVPGTTPGGVDKFDLGGTQNSTNTVAPFSSCGPVAVTNRTKPDLVAPGVCILSARSTSLGNLAEMQKWASTYGAVPDSWGGPGKQVVFCSGTSMAAPAVSGCAALVREVFARNYTIITPWAPLLKALLINGADILTGDRTKEGFGRVNIARTLAHLTSPYEKIRSGEAGVGFWQADTDHQLDVATLTITVPKPAKTINKMHLRATLVYHDLPGHEIQNFLGLGLGRKGSTLFTRNYDKSKPQWQAGWNNVQRVTAANVTPGEQWEIQVVKEQPLLANSPWGVAWMCMELPPNDDTSIKSGAKL